METKEKKKKKMFNYYGVKYCRETGNAEETIVVGIEDCRSIIRISRD